jgi:hypothetical protein
MLLESFIEIPWAQLTALSLNVLHVLCVDAYEQDITKIVNWTLSEVVAAAPQWKVYTIYNYIYASSQIAPHNVI